jgi:hypothetical protein
MLPLIVVVEISLQLHRSFGSMLWLLVSLIPAQFGIIPDFFEGFFHLFHTLH